MFQVLHSEANSRRHLSALKISRLTRLTRSPTQLAHSSSQRLLQGSLQYKWSLLSH